jgi:hypothetical protein
MHSEALNGSAAGYTSTLHRVDAASGYAANTKLFALHCIGLHYDLAGYGCMLIEAHSQEKRLRRCPVQNSNNTVRVLWLGKVGTQQS